MPRREIARRLGVDIKTVRRQLRRIEAGATAPQRMTPPSKLAPFAERIAELVALGRTALSIHAELSSDPAFDASYDLVKRHAARLRTTVPRVYERLEHPPGAEAQLDFGELCRVQHEGCTVRTWAFVMVWPHSRYRIESVVLDQSVPTFLDALQEGLREAGTAPERLSLDNFRSAVLAAQLGLRAYQHEFAKFCAHYETMPNAVRPRTPTDKGAVENAVGALKKSLRGRTFATLEDLRTAVREHQRSYNQREHSVTRRKPADLFEAERRGALPEPYPIATWSEHKVRTDCHVQVLRNFYSVPYTLVGKTVVVRVDRTTVRVFSELQQVALHDRVFAAGRTVTDRAHYPEHKRRSTQEIHEERVARVRDVGPGAAAFLHGLLRSREHVHSDSYRHLLRLIESTEAALLERACVRAAHFENFSLPALREILERRLYDLPLDDLNATSSSPIVNFAIVRPLEVYAQLLRCAS
jgi:transposase